MIEIDFEKLRLIGLTPSTAQQAAIYEQGALVRVTQVHRETVQMHDGREEYAARLLPKLLRELSDSNAELAVGDWAIAEHQHGEWWLHERIEPDACLMRRDASGQRHALVSNVDIAFIVMGLDKDYNLRRLERYLALIHASGESVMPVIVLTKMDICNDVENLLGELRTRLGTQSHIPVHAVNGLSVDAKQELMPYIVAGQTAVLLGSSGAGKSTLTNALLGHAVQDTGEVRSDDSRGRHTTTTRSLHVIAGGGCIIDTPGLRALRPDADEQAIAASFDDIEALSQHCRFRDCSHEDEPDCAVREHVDADRLKNYHKLLREARRDTITSLERQAQAAKWNAIGRSTKAWMKIKRGN